MSEPPAEVPAVPASSSRLRALAERGYLSRGGFHRALELLETEALGPAVTRHATWFALALLVSGVIFFVAANWAVLGFYFRIGLVATAMVLCCLYGVHRGLDTLQGRAAALSGGLLFGPVMAIYGQHFQTGADSHGLFITWAIVMAVFALGTRFVGAWLAVWVLTHISVLTWMEQMRGIELFDDGGAGLAFGLALANLCVALAIEGFNESRQRQQRPVLFGAHGQCRWLTNACLIGFFTPATALASALILKSEPSREVQLGALVFAIAAPGLIWAYLRRWADIIALSFALFSSSIVLTVAFYEWPLGGLEVFGGFWILGMAVCAQMWLLAKVSMRARMSKIYLEARGEGLSEHSPSPTVPPDSGSSKSSMADVWQQLVNEGFARAVDQDAPQPLRAALGLSPDTTPAFMTTLLMVFGTWVGAIMIDVFLLGVVEIQEMPPVAAVVGGLSLLVAIVVSRRFQSIAATQLIWICGVSGQLLMLAAAYKTLGSTAGEAIYALMLCGLQIVSLTFIRDRSYQVASLVALAGHACWFFAEAHLRPTFAFEIMVLVIYLLLALIWRRDDPTKPQRATVWGLGLPLAALVPLLASGRRAWFEGPAADADGWSPPTPWLSDLMLAAGLTALWMWLLVTITRARGEVGKRNLAVLTGTAAVSLTLAVPMPGVMAGMILASLGLWRRSRYLLVFAYLHLGGFLALYYYELAFPLLGKSVTVLATAVVVLGLARASVPNLKKQTSSSGFSLTLQISDVRRLAWGLALALIIPAVAIVDKELLLARGQPMLLKLRPVDPRSLIQGDYMRLEYEITQFAMKFEFEGQPAPESQLVVQLDDQGVAQWASSIVREPLKAEERRLTYKRRGPRGRVRLGAESFFFEEGQADVYDKAKYAELVVDTDGRSVLVGLRDHERRRLGAPLHDLPEWVPGLASPRD